MICENCKAKIPTLATRLKHVNARLHTISGSYYKWVPWDLIEEALKAQGFDSEFPLTMQRDTTIHQPVGEGKWLSVSWYRMESGNYEVTAYVN